MDCGDIVRDWKRTTPLFDFAISLLVFVDVLLKRLNQFGPDLPKRTRDQNAWTHDTVSTTDAT